MKHIICILLVALLTQYLFLDWGLPNQERSLLVFGSKEKIDEYSSLMDSSHDTVTTKDSSLTDSMRSYLLRSGDPDEHQVLVGLSNLRARPTDLDPNDYRYGEFWYYCTGLKLAHAELQALGGHKPKRDRREKAMKV